jgi:beta-ketoacyl synthase-like protein
MRVYVEGVSLRGPGLGGWQESQAVLTSDEPYAPAPAIVPPCSILPANERRRTVRTVKLALAVGAEAFAQAGRSTAETTTVFASSGGDGDTIHEILTALAAPEREMSPTRFHNSVHNAPAGYWNIATHSHAPSSSLCCYDASFAVGLIEAAALATVDRCPVGLIAYDVPYPEPLNRVRPIAAVFGAALILAPDQTSAAFARLDIKVPGVGNRSRMNSRALEELRAGTPAARSLPLLAALARAAPAALVLEYLGGLGVGVSVEPLAAAARRHAARVASAQ